MSPLQIYCQGVINRTHRDGWIEIIMPILAPFIAQLIGQCFKSGPQMRESVSNLNFSQRLAIMAVARKTATAANIPVFRGRGKATAAIAKAIEEELKSTLLLDAGNDSWQEAFDEATRYSV